ncbi:MAG: alanine:cation symporter family protein, partial [Candidatus Coproplasma sp.]
YGEKAVEYLFRNTGEKGKKISVLVFKIIYLLLVVVAAIINGELAWAISDTFNGLMALPNLIGLVIMSGLVVKISKNYFQRKKGEDVEPMLSAYPEQNAQFIEDERQANLPDAEESAEEDNGQANLPDAEESAEAEDKEEATPAEAQSDAQADGQVDEKSLSAEDNRDGTDG